MRAGFAGLTDTIAQSDAAEPVPSVQPPRRFTSPPLGAPAGQFHQRPSTSAFPHGLREFCNSFFGVWGRCVRASSALGAKMSDPKAFILRVEAAWRKRSVDKQKRRLTRLHVHVAAKLAFWRSPSPRHGALARAANCSKRTVRRAMALLHALGLLSWTRRVVSISGWRANVSNSYQFLSTKPFLLSL